MNFSRTTETRHTIPYDYTVALNLEFTIHLPFQPIIVVVNQYMQFNLVKKHLFNIPHKLLSMKNLFKTVCFQSFIAFSPIQPIYFNRHSKIF